MVVVIDHLLLDYVLPLASLLYGSISFIFASDLPYEHIYLKLGTSKPEGCDMTPSLWKQAAKWLLLPLFVGRKGAQIKAMAADSASLARRS